MSSKRRALEERIAEVFGEDLSQVDRTQGSKFRQVVDEVMEWEAEWNEENVGENPQSWSPVNPSPSTGNQSN